MQYSLFNTSTRWENQTMRLLFSVLAAVLASQIAFAQEPNVNGQRLAATCASCHGTNGISTGSILPSLAGQSRDALLTSMKAFKEGSRQATIMHQIAKGYTDEQIELIISYLAAQKK
jgi:sulfide dehydrogenase cytochrome subunit